MAALVVDASVSLAWALPEEISDYADAALAAIESDVLRVPELRPREVANGLAMAYIRNRLTLPAEQKFLAELARLTIHVDTADALSVIRGGTAAAEVMDSPLTTRLMLTWQGATHHPRALADRHPFVLTRFYRRVTLVKPLSYGVVPVRLRPSIPVAPGGQLALSLSEKASCSKS